MVQKVQIQPGTAARAYNPKMQETEAGGLQAGGKLEIWIKTLAQKRKKNRRSQYPAKKESEYQLYNTVGFHQTREEN